MAYEALNPLSNLIPHHIGVATQSIKSELPIFEALGFGIEGEFIDEVQGIRGVFITSKIIDQYNSKFPYRLELLENLPQSTRLDNYLKNHHKLYHIAFETHNIQADSKAILDFRLTQSADLTGGGDREKKFKTQNACAHHSSKLFFKALFYHAS